MSQSETQPSTIILPENFPVPVFTFGQEVYLKDSDNNHGTIIGMRCAPMKYYPRYWEYAFYQEHLGIRDDWHDEDQFSVNPWPEEEE